MKRTIAACTLALWVLPGATSAAPLEDLLPPDPAFLVRIADWPGLREEWSRSALKSLWDDPRVQEFVTPLLEDVEKDRGADDEDWNLLHGILGEGTGEVVVAVTRPARSLDETELVLLMAVADDDRVRDRLRDASESADIRYGTRRYRGVEARVGLDSRDEEEEAWAVVNGAAIFTDTFASLQEWVDAALDGRSPNFTSSALRERVGDGADISVVLGLDVLLSGFRDELTAEIEEDQAFVGGPAVWTALGLDGWEGCYATIDLEHEAVRFRTGALVRGDTGLAGFWPERPANPARPRFFPPGALTYSAGALRLEEWWDTVLEMASAVDPSYGNLIHDQVVQLTRSYGVDFETDLLQGMGDTWYLASYPRKPGPDAGIQLPQLIALSVGRRGGLEAVLDGLRRGDLGAFMRWETRLSHGIEVFVSPVAPDLPHVGKASELACAFAGDYLLVSTGGADLIQRALALETGSGPSLWDDPEFAEAVGGLHPDASTIEYVDTPALLDYLIRNLIAAARDEDAPDPGPALAAARELLGPFTASGRLVAEPAPGASGAREFRGTGRLMLRP